MRMEISYEAIGAAISFITALYAIYTAGVKFGRMSERLAALEEKNKGHDTIIELLRTKLGETAHSSMISGMESRLQNQIAEMSRALSENFQHLTARIDSLVHDDGK